MHAVAEQLCTQAAPCELDLLSFVSSLALASAGFAFVALLANDGTAEGKLLQALTERAAATKDSTSCAQGS